MIIGPVLGGCMCAAYFLEGATVEEEVVSAAPTAQPGGAWRRRGTGVDTPRSAPRFKGSRQVFEDGVFKDVEDVEAPAPPEPTVAEVVEAITAPPKPTKQGAEVIAGPLAVPVLPPLPVFPPKEPDLGAQARKRKLEIARFNAAVIARILPELMEW